MSENTIALLVLAAINVAVVIMAYRDSSRINEGQIIQNLLMITYSNGIICHLVSEWIGINWEKPFSIPVSIVLGAITFFTMAITMKMLFVDYKKAFKESGETLSRKKFMEELIIPVNMKKLYIGLYAMSVICTLYIVY